MINIILLGDPAAGKATQSALLAKKYNLRDFDMGKELLKIQHGRGNVSAKAALAKTFSKGKLTPTALVRDLQKKVALETPKSKGVLFDGNPKMITEAKLVSKYLKQAGRNEIVFLYLSLPQKDIIKRMSERKVYFKRKFSKRPDDNIKALKNRLKYYNTNIREVVDFFKSKYPNRKISGLGTVQEVNARIVKAINELAN